MSWRKTLLQVIGTGRSVKHDIPTPDFHSNQPNGQRNPIRSPSLNSLVCKTGTRTILPSPSLWCCTNKEANRCKNISYSSTTIKNIAIFIRNSSKKLKHCKKLLRMCPKCKNHPYSNRKIPYSPPELLPRFPAHPKDAFRWDFPSWLVTSFLNNTNDSIYSPSGQPQDLQDEPNLCVQPHLPLYCWKNPWSQARAHPQFRRTQNLAHAFPTLYCASKSECKISLLYSGEVGPWECFVVGVWSGMSSLAHSFSKDGPTNSQCTNIHIKIKRKMSVVLCSPQNFSHISSF